MQGCRLAPPTHLSQRPPTAVEGAARQSAARHILTRPPSLPPSLFALLCCTGRAASQAASQAREGAGATQGWDGAAGGIRAAGSWPEVAQRPARGKPGLAPPLFPSFLPPSSPFLSFSLLPQRPELLLPSFAPFQLPWALAGTPARHPRCPSPLLSRSGPPCSLNQNQPDQSTSTTRSSPRGASRGLVTGIHPPCPSFFSMLPAGTSWSSSAALGSAPAVPWTTAARAAAPGSKPFTSCRNSVSQCCRARHARARGRRLHHHGSERNWACVSRHVSRHSRRRAPVLPTLACVRPPPPRGPNRRRRRQPGRPGAAPDDPAVQTAVQVPTACEGRGAACLGASLFRLLGSLGLRRQMIRPYKQLYRCPPPARAGVPLAWALAWAQAYLGF